MHRELETMNNTIQIKAFATHDHSQWLDLWQQYQLFYQANIASEVSQQTWKKLTDDCCTHIYGFAAMQGNQMVGIVHVIEHDSCWTLQPYAYLQDLFVLPIFRGQGIARQLIEQVYAHAMHRQCDRVYWLTHENNQVAQQLYDKVAQKTGFIQYKMLN